MIDLHCHLLPGVDDGPGTLEESLALARLMVADGIQRVVATPHLLAITRKRTWDNLHAILAELRQGLADAGIALEVGLAAEVRVCAELINLVLAGQAPQLGRWQGQPLMLLEFPHTATLPFGSDKMIRWLVGQGIRPLIAHPERNRTFQRDPDELDPYLRAGCLLQVTAGSLVGDFGPAARETALALLDRDLVTLVATDAHDPHERVPRLRAAFELMAHRIDEATAVRLTRETPQRILDA